MNEINTYGVANSSHVDPDMPPPVFAMTQGLQGYNQHSEESLRKLLDDFDPSLILTSPGPTSGYTSFAVGHMDTDAEMLEDMNPGAIPNEPAPTVPPALFAQNNPDAVITDSVSNMDTIDAIEPTVRIDSVEERRAFEQNPMLMDESFASIESLCSRNNSGRVQEPPPLAVIPPSPRPAVATTSASRQETQAGPSTPIASANTSTSTEGWPKLPEAHEFKISVKFLGICVLEEIVKKPMGCLIYYNRESQQAQTVPSGRFAPQPIAITTSIRTEKDGVFQYEDMPWQRDSHKKYTQMILHNFDKGLLITTRNGDLFAKRLCNTKLFWTSTQRQDTDAVELPREVETRVFDMQQFKENFKQAYVNGTQNNIRLPAVRFSFAQKWNIGSCSLSTKLVSASIEPLEAGEMVRWINPDVKPTEYYESYHTSLIQISNTSSN